MAGVTVLCVVEVTDPGTGMDADALAEVGENRGAEDIKTRSHRLRAN